MKMKYFLLLIFVILISVAAVSAGENQTVMSSGDDVAVELVASDEVDEDLSMESDVDDSLASSDEDELSVDSGVDDALAVSDEGDDALAANSEEEVLEKSYYYDEYGTRYNDDTVDAYNVVKYYGDKSKKFRIDVYNDDYSPASKVWVSFGKIGGIYKEKRTNSLGVVYFPINYKVGKYKVETYIESTDGTCHWSAFNTVKIKTTIPTKALFKFSKSKKKFKVKFLNVKGKALAGKYVKIKRGKHWYKLKTNKKGYAQFKSNFKIGTHKITAYNPASKEYKKIKVSVLKKGVHKVSIRIDDPTYYFPTKKLKNGDELFTVYETEYRQYSPGAYVQACHGGLDNPKHTKLIKAKFYFENWNTGKIVTKTSKKVKYDMIMVKPISGYSPYKVTVWYKDIN